MRNFLFILLMLSPVLGTVAYGARAYRDNVTITSMGTAQVTTSSSEVLAADNKRNYLLIQNQHTDNMYVKFGTSQITDEGVKIIPGGYYEPFHAPREAVRVITTSGTGTVQYVNGR